VATHHEVSGTGTFVELNGIEPSAS
jgi:hypothetical protein